MADFVVSLGGGINLDGAGELSAGAPDEGVQVYTPPDDLTLDPKAIAATLRDISKLLQDNRLQEGLAALGAPAESAELLTKAARLGATAASAVNIYALVVSFVFSIVEQLSSSGRLSGETRAIIDAVERRARAADIEQLMIPIKRLHEELNGRLDEVHGQLLSIQVQHPFDANARAAAAAQIDARLPELAVVLRSLESQQWAPQVIKDEYFHLVGTPGLQVSTGGGWADLSSILGPGRWFDHRLGVPVLLYTAAAYPALLQATEPAFRSRGAFAPVLRRLATTLDAFATRMARESFAQTRYADLGEFVANEMVLDQRAQGPGASTDPWLGWRTRPLGHRAGLVGAVDVVNSTNNWFSWNWGEAQRRGEGRAHVGTLNFSWPDAQPPAGQTWLAEANREAADRVALLQAAAGLPQLIAAAARLRFLSTPPTTSETVTGETAARRTLSSTHDVEVTSGPIFPAREVTADATQQRCQARAGATVSLQRPADGFQFHYRISLLTIDSRIGRAWSSPSYVGRVWNPVYVKASGDPRNHRMVDEGQPSDVLWRKVLHQGPSLASGGSSDTTTAVADTFDWYVPTRRLLYGPEAITPHLTRATALASATGQGKPFSVTPVTSVHLRTMPALRGAPSAHVMAGPGPLGELDDGLTTTVLGVLDDPAFEGGERRWARTDRDVSLTWSTSWHDGQLKVVVDGDPDDRPFQLWLVVEETVYSGEALAEGVDPLGTDPDQVTQIHTAFPLDLNNQVTLVPDDFFRREREALDDGKALWNDLQDKYAKSKPPGIDSLGPLHQLLQERIGERRDTAAIIDDLSRGFALIHADDPELVAGFFEGRGLDVDLSALARWG